MKLEIGLYECVTYKIYLAKILWYFLKIRIVIKPH